MNNPRVSTYTTASNSRARPEAQHCLEGRGRGQVNTGLQLWVLGVKREQHRKKQTKIPGDILEEEKEWTINIIDRSFI